MPITTEDAPKTLPVKAKSIYVAAWNSAYDSTCKDRSDRDACSSKIAWSAVKRKFKKEGDTWVPKTEYVNFSMFIDKAVYNKEAQELRWHCVASDVDDDSHEDNMTMELFESFLSRVESGEAPPEKYCSDFWSGGQPYLSLGHYSDQNGDAVPGPVECVYIDGEKFKGKGKFYNNPLGWACFNAINEDKFAVDKSDKNPVRISIAFLDYKHKHKSNGEIFVRESLDDFCPWCLLESLTGNGEGKEYLDGHLIHLALTRVPVNKRTEMEVSRSMTTRKDDVESIVGEDMAEELEERESQFKSEALVTMSEDEEVEKAEEKEEEEEDKKKKKDEEKEEKSEAPRHVLQSAFDAYKSDFDQIMKAEGTSNEKLQAMQNVLENLATATRAQIEGTTVEAVVENQELEQLRSEIAQLRQDIAILTQSQKEKSNVQETAVPPVRSFQPQQVVTQPQPAQEEYTESGFRTLNSIIRKSVE